MTTLPTTFGRSVADANRPQHASQLRTLEALLLRVSARMGRLIRWEFWPSWILYAMLLPHLVRLAIRHRSVTLFTSANPGIPLGGLVGESKADILSLLPPCSIVPTTVIEPACVTSRCDALAETMTARGWSFPLILKPDVGERGSGVRLIRTTQAALKYFERHPERVLAQVYHPGPFEAGVFYVRHPAKKRGRIFSMTHKVPPRVVGDGRSNLETLIWRHPRLRFQARVLLDRLGQAAGRVPSSGEEVLLAVAGNHCQGTMFCDGAHLLTPALARAIDQVASSAPGFYFGRFDIRYTSTDHLRAGQGFQVIELNGVLSESTNIYDPAFGLLRALRVLARQWRLAFEIASENAHRGAHIPTIRNVLQAVLRHQSRSSERESD